MRGLFVTGTDTGVGKTVLTAGLSRALRARGMDVGVAKPIATGAVRRGGFFVSLDAEFLRKVSGVLDSSSEICPLVYRTPAAPTTAAELENKPVDFALMRAGLAALASKHEWMLVEGIGGWRVPISEDYAVSDMAAELGLPVLVAARAGLGTINHTTLTVESARARGLDVAGVVMMRSEADADDVTVRHNARLIERVAKVEVLGTIPYDPTLSVEEGRAGNIVALVEGNIDMDRLVDLLKQGGADK